MKGGIWVPRVIQYFLCQFRVCLLISTYDVKYHFQHRRIVYWQPNYILICDRRVTRCEWRKTVFMQKSEQPVSVSSLHWFHVSFMAPEISLRNCMFSIAINGRNSPINEHLLGKSTGDWRIPLARNQDYHNAIREIIRCGRWSETDVNNFSWSYRWLGTILLYHQCLNSRDTTINWYIRVGHTWFTQCWYICFIISV